MAENKEISPTDVARFIDKAAKILSDMNVKEPFTIYVNQAQFSKEVLKRFKKAHCYNMFLKIMKKGKVVKTL